MVSVNGNDISSDFRCKLQLTNMCLKIHIEQSSFDGNTWTFYIYKTKILKKDISVFLQHK